MITNMKESHGAQLVVFRSFPGEPRRSSVIRLLLTRSQHRNASGTLLILLLRIML